MTPWVTNVTVALTASDGKNVIGIFPMGGGKSSVIPIGLARLFRSYTHLQPRVNVAVEEAYSRSVEIMKRVPAFFSADGRRFKEVQGGCLHNPGLELNLLSLVKEELWEDPGST